MMLLLLAEVGFTLCCCHLRRWRAPRGCRLRPTLLPWRAEQR